MIRDYEVMTITKEDLSKSISDSITSVGGEIVKADVWGKRRFAYEIKHESEGYYDVIQFKLDSDKIDNLKRKLNLNQSIVRYLITIVEEIKNGNQKSK